MTINKSKKDPQDNPSKDTKQQSGITVDTAAAAAILQAATRGIKKPNLDIFSKTTISGQSHGSSNEGGQASSLGSSVEKEIENHKLGLTIPIAKEIAKNAARSAASEADSSEAGLTRDQKLKAERLRRAKMFAAMIKSGSLPLGTPEPSNFEVHGEVNGEVKDREGSLGLTEVGTSTRIDVPLRNSSDGENERKANNRRHYRSRKHDESGDDEYEKREKDDDDNDDVDDDDRRRSRKKRRSHHSSRRHRDRSKESRHKHRRKNSSSSKESRHKRKHESSSYDEDTHHKPRHRHDNSSDDERKHRKRKNKHERRERSRKREKSRNEVDLEEGEIRTKSSDNSSSFVGDDNSTDASVDVLKSSCQEKAPSLPPRESTEVPDELRAKIRAMLLATM